jgi:hypothetical protein
MNPLTDALNAERAARAGTNDATSATRKPATNANEIDPARVAALAAELVAKHVHASDDGKKSVTCPRCGSTFSTSPTTKETGADDPEMSPKEIDAREATMKERAKHTGKESVDLLTKFLKR